MKTQMIALALLSMAVGAFAKTAEPKGKPASAAEFTIIDQFSDRLFDLIQKNDVKGYTALFGAPTDQFQNVRNGGPSDIPVKWDVEAQHTLPGKFTAIVSQVEKILGKASGITLKEVEYHIRRDPHDKEFGLFVFDVTLVLEGNKTTMRVWQPACALGMRGILIGDALIVLTATTK